MNINFCKVPVVLIRWDTDALFALKWAVESATDGKVVMEGAETESIEIGSRHVEAVVEGLPNEFMKDREVQTSIIKAISAFLAFHKKRASKELEKGLVVIFRWNELTSIVDVDKMES